MAKETVRDLIVGIRGSHIQTFNHHGAINIARTDKEITELEKKRAQIDATLAELRVINGSCRALLIERQRKPKAKA